MSKPKESLSEFANTSETSKFKGSFVKTTPPSISKLEDLKETYFLKMWDKYMKGIELKDQLRLYQMFKF